ncbi:WD40 repeat domain-containing protein [Alteromonas gilva]|uniref:Translation initiation factor beta propellor-like domain-containing protein n=1 Tax=Alteromonas gilva TaxID=2987522 RepID=A0ABT5KX33_9ALTE|nr:hypothetical protein [Alteromonas gilva]MDC8829320.1 hypothetical protein [Alteromonas gilva]
MFTYLSVAALNCVALSGCIVPDTTPDKQWRIVEEGAYAADVSTDGKLSLVSGINNGIHVWRFGEDQPLYQWSHQGDGNNLVANVHISADNSYAVTSDREAFATWSLTTGEPVGFWRIDESSIRDVAIANGGRGVVVGRSNGQVMFFEPGSGRRLEFLGHQERINSVDVTPNGKYALTGGNDYVAYLWSTESGQVIHSFTHPSRVTLVALDDQGRYAFTADSQQKSQIWNVQTGEPISQLQYIARQKIFTDAVFSADGKYLLTGAPSRRMYLWNVQTGEQVGEWKVAPRENMSPPSAVVYGVGFIDEKNLISVSSSGLAELWSMPES